MVLLTGCLFAHLMLQTKSGSGLVFLNNRQTGLFPQEQSTSRFGHNLPMPEDPGWLSRDTSIVAIDSVQETSVTVLYDISIDATERTDAQDAARDLIISIQNVYFICLLKLYRKLFGHCTPIISITQKPTLDMIQVKSMLDGFLRLQVQKEQPLELQKIGNCLLQLWPSKYQ